MRNFCLLLLGAWLCMTGAVFADGLRLAVWNVELDRKGPGLLAKDIASDKDLQVQAIIRVLDQLQADVLLLTGFDYDYDLIAARLLSDRLSRPYPEVFAYLPNTGMPSEADLNGDGRSMDVQSWGQFSGQGGMLLLSHFPIDREAAEDFSTFLWQDLPQGLHEGVSKSQRLSTTGHWRVPIDLGEKMDFLVYHATPPVFDGPEDQNGRRNHDEAAFWLAYLAHQLPMKPPDGKIVIMGTSNLDPIDGEGRPDALLSLLDHPRVTDHAPKSKNPVLDHGHKGDAAQDTARFEKTGGLRVEILLPDQSLEVMEAAILWPEKDDPLWSDLLLASRHGPVYVDIIPPKGKATQ